MITVETVLSVHWLLCPDHPERRVCFKQLLGNLVRVERYDGNHIHPETMTAEKARKRYSWLRKLGYRKW